MYIYIFQRSQLQDLFACARAVLNALQGVPPSSDIIEQYVVSVVKQSWSRVDITEDVMYTTGTAELRWLRSHRMF